MSENPVRSASVEAAKEFLDYEFANPDARHRQLTDIIEENLAPVVAAAEEAMKEKIRRAVKKELGFIIHQEKVRVYGKYTEKFTPDEVLSYCSSPTSVAWENAQTILEVAIRAIPTGTALAEQIARAVEKAQVDAAVEFHKMQKGKVERATQDIYDKAKTIENLKAQLAEAHVALRKLAEWQHEGKDPVPR